MNCNGGYSNSGYKFEWKDEVLRQGKGTGGKPGEDREIDLIAVDGENKFILIGEVKRNHDRISIPKLEEKSVRILAHHKQWESRFIGLSLEDM